MEAVCRRYEDSTERLDVEAERLFDAALYHDGAVDLHAALE